MPNNRITDVKQEASKATDGKPSRGGAPKKRARRQSEYGKQLSEKQLAKEMYGLRERQFCRYFEQAAKTPAATGERLLQLLEMRLDNVVFRLGFGRTRKQSRQLVSHGHVLVNGKKANIPSQAIKTGDNVEITLESAERGEGEMPGWIQSTKGKNAGKVLSIPTREEIPADINEQLIVEYYSR